MELELESLKSSVMSLTLAANSSAEGEHYRELADAAMKVRYIWWWWFWQWPDQRSTARHSASFVLGCNH